MKQEELENRVREIFDHQGFKVEKTGNLLHACKEDTEKIMQVFSSHSYSEAEMMKDVEPGSIVFVDEGFREIVNELENEVSVIQENERTDHNLPSYEIIGDLVVINELEVEEEEAVEGILDHHPHVKTILVKDDPLEGEYRVGGYRKIYGDETETVHTEFGCRYRLDPTEVYFSERFGTERKRVIDKIEEGEKVLIIGAGVGPFAILAARHAEPEKVVAVEKNPTAHEYLRENIELNNVGEIVDAVEADARELELEEKFDRVIVPIPEFPEDFLESAFNHLDDNGVIHHYGFIEDGNWNEIEKEIETVAEDLGIDYEITDRTVCGDRGPAVKRVCIEIKKR